MLIFFFVHTVKVNGVQRLSLIKSLNDLFGLIGLMLLIFKNVTIFELKMVQKQFSQFSQFSQELLENFYNLLQIHCK